MNAYAFVSRADETTGLAARELARFAIRTTGAFSLYAAFTVDSLTELREAGERLAATGAGEVRMTVSVEEPSVATRSASGGWPASCYDKRTGQIDYDCLGSPEPSGGPKASAFAVAEITAVAGLRDLLHSRLAATGNVVGLARLLDPRRVLVEVSNPEPGQVLATLVEIEAMAEVSALRSGVAVEPVPHPTIPGELRAAAETV